MEEELRRLEMIKMLDNLDSELEKVHQFIAEYSEEIEAINNDFARFVAPLCTGASVADPVLLTVAKPVAMLNKTSFLYGYYLGRTHETRPRKDISPN